MAQSSPPKDLPTEMKSAEKINTGNPEDLPWYVKELKDLKPGTRQLFEEYSNIAPNQVTSHIKQIRDEAFKVFPYPCLGHWGFLDLSIGQIPCYNEVLQRLKNGDKYLDIGCCVGQDIRKLVHDGAPSENMYGSDVEKAFWDIGYDLFLDKNSLKTQFIEADVFDDASGLQQLDGKIEIVHAASFLHLFDWTGQVRAAKRIVRLLSKSPGCLILGRQTGNTTASEILAPLGKNKTLFSHNQESFAKLWKQVGEETGTKWVVQAALGEEDLSRRIVTESALIPPGTRIITFVVRME